MEHRLVTDPMTLALVLILSAAEAQDAAEARSVTISKQERSAYIPALEKYRDAEAALSRDPRDCAGRCTELIEDRSVKETCKETRVRIQNTDGSYGEWSFFSPFQLRGRAWLAQAQAPDRERKDAVDLARKAVADLEESVRRGMTSSGPYLERARAIAVPTAEPSPASDPRLVEAQARLKELQALVVQRAAAAVLLRRSNEVASLVRGTSYEGEWRYIRANALRACWTEEAEANRFRSALAIVTRDGDHLSDDERSALRAGIEERCRRSVDGAVERFRSELRETLPVEEAFRRLTSLDDAEFERRFALPEESELVVGSPELEWSRSCRLRLRTIRSTRGAPAASSTEFRKTMAEAAQAALDASPLVRDGENRAFGALEGLAFDLTRTRLKRIVEGAATDPPEALRIRRAESQVVVGDFEEFGARLEKACSAWPDRGEAFRRHHPFVATHLERLRGITALLPSDLERVDQIARALLDPADPGSLWGSSDRPAPDYEAELRGLEQREGIVFSRDCRRRLDTCLLVAAISRLLLSGLAAEAVGRREELRRISRRLEEAGGPDPGLMDGVPPKVRSTLAKLKS